MNDTHMNTISNVYALGHNRHIIYVVSSPEYVFLLWASMITVQVSQEWTQSYSNFVGRVDHSASVSSHSLYSYGKPLVSAGLVCDT